MRGTPAGPDEPTPGPRAATATYARPQVSGSIQSMENVGIVVGDLAAAKAFFVELGLEKVGEAEVAGEWVDRVVGLEDVRCEICMLQTLDGNGRLELMRFKSPAAREADTNAPPNTLGIRRIAFSVDDIDAAVARVRDRGLELLGDVVCYEDIYRLCYVRGPEGIIVMLAERLG
jgi:catechol 2,3-dioxygenase-like lactoylglutathione lyase family enzyme